MNVVDGVTRTLKGALRDNITGEAAKAAFYFFLSLFPMILALFALTGVLGGTAAFEYLMNWLMTALPEGATAYLEEFEAEITGQSRPDALSVGVVLAVWSASNFFAALGDGLDAMFDVKERSSWWRKRLKALLLMVFGVLLLGGGGVALIAGPQIAAASGLPRMAAIIVWPVVFVLLVILLWLIYYIMPAHDQARVKRELLIGAVAGTVIWMAATAVFRLYVSNIADYSRAYGFIGGIIVLLLWLYITAFSILIGGEVADMLRSGDRSGEDSPTQAV